ncbi:hypothetical protein [Ectobacillus ponti]|uniref:Uncharacterized protein n=1 Tax=Ectobacillus ponti TaxID=2961894 RepID=A0AA42BQ79_9BACI|nr:hypothetical protein [Ectobacillus ponti]MCP8969582.1 hypothetical protein [Ectobacillus ponti]
MEIAKRLVVGGFAAVCFLFICSQIGPGKPEPQEELILTDYPAKRSDVQTGYSHLQLLHTTDSINTEAFRE